MLRLCVSPGLGLRDTGVGVQGFFGGGLQRRVCKQFLGKLFLEESYNIFYLPKKQFIQKQSFTTSSVEMVFQRQSIRTVAWDQFFGSNLLDTVFWDQAFKRGLYRNVLVCFRQVVIYVIHTKACMQDVSPYTIQIFHALYEQPRLMIYTEYVTEKAQKRNKHTMPVH